MLVEKELSVWLHNKRLFKKKKQCLYELVDLGPKPHPTTLRITSRQYTTIDMDADAGTQSVLINIWMER